MTDTSDDRRLERIEQGLEVLFASEVAREVFAAVDFEALLADEPAVDAVDVDRLAGAIGRPLGRAIAQYVVDSDGTVGVAKRALGSEIGSRIAAETFRAATENVDVEAVVETLVELDEESPGPELQGAIDDYVEHSSNEQPTES
ncbi:hypothetical protein SAMN04487948_11279 [Halogranum amylolyticum]|uniref:Uncharacterized protein n=1 Tax=Halogranum amylolyticum TaxID=660520 RepID=A0A1H8UTZ0_9EURY|nr:hypothetical protein [Halogranum amylolyticum]SEP06038.1 hypothetical protein SAMN04487948_11279 [Halogranum amylolyticum]